MALAALRSRLAVNSEREAIAQELRMLAARQLSSLASSCHLAST